MRASCTPGQGNSQYLSKYFISVSIKFSYEANGLVGSRGEYFRPGPKLREIAKNSEINQMFEKLIMHMNTYDNFI